MPWSGHLFPRNDYHKSILLQATDMCLKVPLFPVYLKLLVRYTRCFLLNLIRKTKWSLLCKRLCKAAMSFYRSHVSSHTERYSTQREAFSIVNSQVFIVTAWSLHGFKKKSVPKLSCFLETFWFSNYLGILKQEKCLKKRAACWKHFLFHLSKRKLEALTKGVAIYQSRVFL